MVLSGNSYTLSVVAMAVLRIDMKLVYKVKAEEE